MLDFNNLPDDSGLPSVETNQVVNNVYNIKFYNNTAEPNRVDKTDYLGGSGTVISGSFKTEIDMLYPVFEIETNEPFNYNYIKIDWYENKHKYYFIDNIIFVSNNLYRIECSIDVLMTFKNYIKNCYAFVERNEFTYNRRLIDPKCVVESGIDIEHIDTVGNELFGYVDRPFVSYDETQWREYSIVLSGYQITRGV